MYTPPSSRGNRPTSWVQMSSSPLSSPATNQLNEQRKSSLSMSSSNSLATSSSSTNSSLPPQTVGGSVLTSSGEQVAGNNKEQQELIQLQQQQQQSVIEEQQQEDNRKLRLQLYVFVLRCISYSFNAKQANNTDLHQRQQQLKLRKQHLEQVVNSHTRYIRSGSSFSANKLPHQHLKLSPNQLRQLDELYEKAHVTFNRKFLQNERMKLLVESECCSQQDLRDMFRQNAEQLLKETLVFSQPAQRSLRQQRLNEPTTATTTMLSDSSETGSLYSQQSVSANKETLLNSWMIKFESIIREDTDSLVASGSGLQIEPTGSSSPASLVGIVATTLPTNSNQQNISKEQLYQMFQNILNIKKFEHQLLYNALQLDSADEQAAAIRRELDGRIARIAELERNKKLMPKFVLKEMESLYIEEARLSVNKLMVNLDSLPVSKNCAGESRSYGLQKFRRYNNRAQASLTRDGLVESHPSEPTLSKLDVVLTFNIEVIVMEVRGLKQLAPNREIYCTMEIEGSERLQTEHVQAKKPLWDTQGDFTTNHPLPVLKIKLYAVNPSMLSLEDKELGKLVLRPTVLSPKTPEWCTMLATTSTNFSQNTTSSNCSNSISSVNPSQNNLDQELKIRVVVRMDRPQQLKHCGYLWGIGKSTWRKFKRRYHILIQVSQYTFVMCAYKDKKAKPTEMLQLDGYTVDYIEPPTDLIMEHCSEVTSNEHHTSSGTSTTLGLAGRLANVILKQPGSSSSSSSGGGGGSGGSGSGGLGAAGDGGASGGNLGSDCMVANQLEGSSGASGSGEQASAIRTAAALSDELHSKYYFNVVKEGDSVVFACDDEQECFGWVMALYRATGQAHKPTPLRNQYSGSTSHYIDAAFAYNTSASQPTKLVGNSTGSLNSSGSSSLSISSMLNGVKGPKSSVDVADQRARKHGMVEFISADPCKFQHNHLFKYLQNETLRYRLDDSYCSLGWFSSGQVLVLDEYCARYGVRTCFRHLAYLNSLLDLNQRGYFIDHTLLNYGYDFCASHVSGNSGQAHPMGSVNFDLRPDGVGTVTVEERDMFHSIKTKLLKMIERQVSNFSTCFPFGKPDGALKSTLSLLERVLMKEQQTNSMVQNEEVRNLIRKCLEQAALNSYTKLSGQSDLSAPLVEYLQQEAAGSASCSPTLNLQGDLDQDLVLSSQQRARTPSSLSNSSMASYSSSSVSTSTGVHSMSSTVNDSFRRRNPNNLAQQQQPSRQQQQLKCLTMAMIINNEHIKAKDKLKYLIRLAELCCEQVEESNEYFSDAFAWHSDLMMDHFELFWSLFSVDMDKILNELNGVVASSQQQHQQTFGASGPSSLMSLSGRSMGSISGPSGLGGASASQQAEAFLHSATNNHHGLSREVFLLFQILNDHMRKSPNLECRKFKTYLCDTFKPKLLRYIDISESTLTPMLFKAFEKDGQVNCQLIEQMFVKLDDLQKFVLNQLRWPDDQLAEQLHQRLKLIAYELCDACIQRTLQAFQQIERKSNKWTATSTSYASPTEMIQMINIALDTRNRSVKLCTFNNLDKMSYNSKIDKLVDAALGEMQPGLMNKLLSALESTLTRLARHDEGNLLAPILSLTTKQGMSSSGRDIGKQYVTFVSNSCDLLRHKINDELWLVNLLEEWYAAQINVICNWLAERMDHSLHDVQLVALANILPKIYADMSLQGVCEEKLNLKAYQTVISRLKMEEAAALASGCLFEQTSSSSSSIFNTSLLSALTTTTGSNQSPANNPTQTPSANMTNAQSTPFRQPIGYQQQQQQQQQLDSPTIQTRRFQSPLGAQSSFAQTPTQNEPAINQDGDNIADRALQSATRMFKGFWTG